MSPKDTQTLAQSSINTSELPLYKIMQRAQKDKPPSAALFEESDKQDASEISLLEIFVLGNLGLCRRHRMRLQSPAHALVPVHLCCKLLTAVGGLLGLTCLALDVPIAAIGCYLQVFGDRGLAE